MFFTVKFRTKNTNINFDYFGYKKKQKCTRPTR